MKLKDYLDNLNKEIDKDPSLLEAEVVYSKDDEGNEYNSVYFSPTIGVFNEEDREFYSDREDLEEYGEMGVKAICVN